MRSIPVALVLVGQAEFGPTPAPLGNAGEAERVKAQGTRLDDPDAIRTAVRRARSREPSVTFTMRDLENEK